MRAHFAATVLLITAAAQAQPALNNKTAWVGCEADLCTLFEATDISEIASKHQNPASKPAYRIVFLVGRMGEVNRERFETLRKSKPSNEVASFLWGEAESGSWQMKQLFACSNTHMPHVLFEKDGMWSAQPVRINEPPESGGEVLAHSMYLLACHHKDVVDTGGAVGNKYTLASLGYPAENVGMAYPSSLQKAVAYKTANLAKLLGGFTEIQISLQPLKQASAPTFDEPTSATDYEDGYECKIHDGAHANNKGGRTSDSVLRAVQSHDAQHARFQACGPNAQGALKCMQFAGALADDSTMTYNIRDVDSKTGRIILTGSLRLEKTPTYKIVFHRRSGAPVAIDHRMTCKRTQVRF